MHEIGVLKLHGAVAVKPAFVYGGGVNYAIARRISLRMEYRGSVYGVPDFGYDGLNPNFVTHTAQPSIGLSFRF